MKSCLHCKYAKWDRTAAGKLHPSGDGRCTFPYKVPPLPQALYWTGVGAPRPNGWHINRKEELKDHCVYYAREEQA